MLRIAETLKTVNVFGINAPINDPISNPIKINESTPNAVKKIMPNFFQSLYFSLGSALNFRVALFFFEF